MTYTKLTFTKDNGLPTIWEETFGTDTQDFYLDFVTWDYYCDLPDGTRIVPQQGVDPMEGGWKAKRNVCAVVIVANAINRNKDKLDEGRKYAEEHGIPMAEWVTQLEEFINNSNNVGSTPESYVNDDIVLFADDDDEEDNTEDNVSKKTANIVIDAFTNAFLKADDRWSRIDDGAFYIESNLPTWRKSAFLFGTRENPLALITIGAFEDHIGIVYRLMAPPWAPKNSIPFKDIPSNVKYRVNTDDKKFEQMMHDLAIAIEAKYRKNIIDTQNRKDPSASES